MHLSHTTSFIVTRLVLFPTSSVVKHRHCHYHHMRACCRLCLETKQAAEACGKPSTTLSPCADMSRCQCTRPCKASSWRPLQLFKLQHFRVQPLADGYHPVYFVLRLHKMLAHVNRKFLAPLGKVKAVDNHGALQAQRHWLLTSCCL